jgi:hypothetical protein
MKSRFARPKHMIAASVVVMAATALPAVAIDDSRGQPGHCQDDKGVTVVIDFGKLGGTPIVRCNPTGSRGTGLDALKGAGFQIAGVQRWGESFICRIENRPASNEKLAITGNASYRESCIDTPPASGYWSYWHAGNNCAWEYSQWGVKNRDFIRGGFEGWSFSLNASMDSAPQPRVAAVRPGTAGGACQTESLPGPKSNDRAEKQQAAEPANKAGSAGGNLPAPKPRNATKADDPSEDVQFSGGEDAPDVTETLKEQAGSSNFAPWVAGAAVTMLAGTAWWTARRRRRTLDRPDQTA